jgi:hypothetical protein
MDKLREKLNINFVENPSSGSRGVTCRRADGQTDIHKGFSKFYKRAKNRHTYKVYAHRWYCHIASIKIFEISDVTCFVTGYTFIYCKLLYLLCKVKNQPDATIYEVLLTQRVSGTSMPIIRSTNSDYRI